jgi:hypothetical protein
MPFPSGARSAPAFLLTHAQKLAQQLVDQGRRLAMVRNIDFLEPPIVGR